MLTVLTDLEQVAVYNIALPVMQIFLSLMLPIVQVFTPVTTENCHKRDKKAILGHLNLLIITLIFCIFLCVLGILALMEQVWLVWQPTFLFFWCLYLCFIKTIQLFNKIVRTKL
ncbi:MAG: hypothetical protein H7A23_25580 [Leptospiraceae bacterium]|nr:hypothetical protein [Leptospiraceae bacterium]MCP5497939.1 hypothetical protein [Leptospiraceae bacterium]